TWAPPWTRAGRGGAVTGAGRGARGTTHAAPSRRTSPASCTSSTRCDPHTHHIHTHTLYTHTHTHTHTTHPVKIQGLHVKVYIRAVFLSWWVAIPKVVCGIIVCGSQNV